MAQIIRFILFATISMFLLTQVSAQLYSVPYMSGMATPASYPMPRIPEPNYPDIIEENRSVSYEEGRR